MSVLSRLSSQVGDRTEESNRKGSPGGPGTAVPAD